MITQLLLTVFFVLADNVLSLIPAVEWSVNAGAFSTFLDYVSVGAYLLPMGTVLLIIRIIISLIAFRIAISIVKTIWQLLPIL